MGFAHVRQNAKNARTSRTGSAGVLAFQPIRPYSYLSTSNPGDPMKINLTVDCTPEEARRAMGLPDFTPVHDRYIGMLTDTMEKGASPEMLDQMMRSWAPMGEAGINFWRKMFESAARGG